MSDPRVVKLSEKSAIILSYRTRELVCACVRYHVCVRVCVCLGEVQLK